MQLEVSVRGAIERVFREEHGRVAAALIGAFRDFELAEEAIQDAYTVALERWPRAGIPPNPAAWITTTARRRTIDLLRRERVRQQKYATLTNDDILKIVKQSGENQRADLALRQKYFHIYSKKLDPIAAARFLQLDDIVGMVTRLAILGNLPLIGDVPHSAASGENAPASSERETPPLTGDQPSAEPQK